METQNTEATVTYVDAGQIRLHARVPVGTRLEESERTLAKVEDIIRSAIPAPVYL